MSEASRLISPDKRGEDLDVTLRPQTLDDFTGHAGIVGGLVLARRRRAPT